MSILSIRAGITRRAILCGFVAAVSTTALPAFSADYPTKPIRIVVPYTPGGVTDMIARTLARSLSDVLHQPVIVENQPGAAATLGARAVARADPDGYTLLLGTNGTHGTNSSSFAKLDYDPILDFEPVVLLGQTSLMLVVRSDLPVQDFPEFLEWLRNSGEEVNYASTGRGGGVHLITEQFMLQTGTDMLHIPYKGSSQALNDLMAGHVDVMFDNLASSVPLLAGDRLRGLAVTGKTRSSLASDVPTIDESGVSGFEASNWLGIYAPAGTDEDIVETLNKTINSILHDDLISSSLLKAGFEPAGGSADSFQKKTASEIEKWASVAKQINLSPE